VQYTTLVEVFSQVPDPCKRKGRRHRRLTLLCLIAAALASAQCTPRAIAGWVKEHRSELFALLPASVSRLPSEATLRRALALLPVESLEQALSAFCPATAPARPTAALSPQRAPPPAQGLAALAPEPAPALQGVAIDGKAIRGVGRDGHPCQLVSLVRHRDARVLGQVQVATKRDERSAVPELLEGRDLSGRVVTLDALHTLRPTARLIRAQNGHYLMIVKKNQAALYEYLDLLFTLPAHRSDREVWDSVGPTSQKRHGRLERRSLRSGNAHIEDVDWPDVQQVVRRECERIILKTGKRSCEVTNGLVSMKPEQAGAAAIERLWRGHWTIENPVHYVRDVTFGEDAGHAAQGNTPHVLAALRNGLLMLFRSAHWRSIPDALAHYGASVAGAFALIGLEVKT
jgi:predicted transposase YbfD/YdcC